MTESKCSPEPWQIAFGFFSPQIRDANGDLVAEDIYGVGDTVDSEYECKIANARLIAAAPDLLAALTDARETIGALPIDALGEGGCVECSPDGECGQMVWPLRDELLDKINAAIAKARGEGADVSTDA